MFQLDSRPDRAVGSAPLLLMPGPAGPLALNAPSWHVSLPDEQAAAEQCHKHNHVQARCPNPSIS